MVRFKTIIEECLTWGRKKEAGQVIYGEIEIGKVSELQVKWRCFAGRVALQNGQNARGGYLETA